VSFTRTPSCTGFVRSIVTPAVDFDIPDHFLPEFPPANEIKRQEARDLTRFDGQLTRARERRSKRRRSSNSAAAERDARDDLAEFP
jgi:hypothetical protein